MIQFPVFQNTNQFSQIFGFIKPELISHSENRNEWRIQCNLKFKLNKIKPQHVAGRGGIYQR